MLKFIKGVVYIKKGVIFVLNKQIEIMKNTLRNKVIAKLIKSGNNVNDVNEMVNIHFDQASKNYSSVNTIAQYIRTVY